MATVPLHRLEQVIDRFEEVEARMGAVSDPDEIVALSKEHSELKEIAEKARELAQARANLDEAEAMLPPAENRTNALMMQTLRARVIKSVCVIN